MDDIYKLIRKFNNDEAVINLKNYYNSLSFMEILGVTRKEEVHSSFLAWLFDSKINYDLKNKPLLLLLDLLIEEDDKNNFSTENKEDITLRNASIIIDNVETEYPIEDGRIDIYIQFKIDNNQYAIVIENKVDAKENIESEEKNGIMQTEKYYNYFKNEKSNIKYIYAFLSPLHNGEKVIAKDKHFINISYNDILKNIINPILADTNILDKTRFILDDYIKVLSKPNIIDPDKTVIIATSEFETDLANKIRNKNDELGRLLISNDENDIIKEFMSDNINKLIVTSVWPEAIKKRNSNSSFLQLGIEVGTKLYLAKTPKSNEIKSKDLHVTTLDESNKVEYIDKNGIKQVKTISPAAKDLLSLNYTPNGYQYFVYENQPGQFISLYNINKK